MILLKKAGRSLTMCSLFVPCGNGEGAAVMVRATFFTQECPTCGRSVQVRVEYLGRSVACMHCRGHFKASDPDGSAGYPLQTEESLLERVDALLDSGVQDTAHRYPPR